MDPHRAQITREFFDQAEERGIFVGAVPAEAHWHMGQVENHARYLRMMGKPRMEDMIIDEVDVQKLLDELTDAKNNLVQHDGYLLRQWFCRIITSCSILKNTDRPLLAFAGRVRKQAQNRHNCQMSAIEVEANTKIRKGLIGRFRPMSGDYVLGDALYYRRDVTCESHWC